MPSLDGPSPKDAAPESPQSPAPNSYSSLRSVIQSYDKLIDSVRSDLPESTRTAVDSALSHIRLRLPVDMTSFKMPYNTAAGATFSQHRSADYSTHNPRYIGEASDVHFFHTIERIFRDKDQSGGSAANDTQSYDRGILHLEAHDGRESQTDLPTKSLADTYIEIYFFTIHIAYPFVNKPSFMTRYERFWNGDIDIAETPSWLPLLCKWLLTVKVTDLILT
jgi:hypothetical protein